MPMSLFGQKDSTNKLEWYEKEHPLFGWLIPDSVINSHICLKIAPLGLIDPHNGMTPRVGIEYKLKASYALYNEIGTYIPNANGKTHNTGILLKCEFKRYLNKNNITAGQYVSTELFYKYQSYGTTDSIGGGPIIYSKDYSVSKNVGNFSIKYGSMRTLKFNVILESFVAIGIRYKVTRSTLTSNENENIISSDDSYNINVLVNTAGTFITPIFEVGLKIGYRLK